MARGNATRHPEKRLTAVNGEAQMVQYLCSPALTQPVRAAITAEALVRKFPVSLKTAEYRLQLAQQRWRAE